MLKDAFHCRINPLVCQELLFVYIMEFWVRIKFLLYLHKFLHSILCTLVPACTGSPNFSSSMYAHSKISLDHLLLIMSRNYHFTCIFCIPSVRRIAQLMLMVDDKKKDVIFQTLLNQNNKSGPFVAILLEILHFSQA